MTGGDHPGAALPLGDLRAFDAAARHLSFTRAAAELGVTQGAVSQRIKALEARVGAPLFERTGRAVVLTGEGARLAAAVADGFARLAAGLAVARGVAIAPPLTISALPSFASRWLIPRLPRFEQRHPGVAIRVLADDRLADFAAEAIDLGIRFGGGRYPGLTSSLLAQDPAVPVASPRLATADCPLDRPADLRHHRLLHDGTAERGASGVTWARWLAAAAVTLPDGVAGPRFSHAHLAIEAAVAGAGVALGRLTLVADDLASGRLVQPFGPALLPHHAYHLVRRRGAPAHPDAAAFESWLRAELAANPASP